MKLIYSGSGQLEVGGGEENWSQGKNLFHEGEIKITERRKGDKKTQQRRDIYTSLGITMKRRNAKQIKLIFIFSFEFMDRTRFI